MNSEYREKVPSEVLAKATELMKSGRMPNHYVDYFCAGYLYGKEEKKDD